MIELAAVLLVGMVFTWYMLTNYAIVIDTTETGVTLIGIAPKVYPEDKEDK